MTISQANDRRISERRDVALDKSSDQSPGDRRGVTKYPRAISKRSRRRIDGRRQTNDRDEGIQY